METRRVILNAIIFGRLHELDLPAHVVSWHVIWLWHAGRVEYNAQGGLVERHPRHAAA